ncbi:MAG TPA: acyl-CoA thioesterase domain-containing protein [Mycobacterium sp.]|nr:acyl-CoA thioesterase domain-containing protein [Mycobacterium sp.]
MSFTIGGLLHALQLKQVGVDRYLAHNVDTGAPVVFGGQLLAQSIVAALVGHEGKTVKTLHSVFARAGSPQEPLDIDVDPLHRGRAMASSTVTFRQGDRRCARSMVLLTADEPDVIRHADRPAAHCRLDEASGRDPAEAGGWEVRIAAVSTSTTLMPSGRPNSTSGPAFPAHPTTNRRARPCWPTPPTASSSAPPCDPIREWARPKRTRQSRQGCSATPITFCEPFSAAEWLLLSHHSPYAGRGRSYGRADAFREDGQLVASFVQDSMIRHLARRSSAL